MNKDLFNKEALEKVSSPEQLDTAIRVISPGNRFAIAGVALMLFAVVTWSIVGAIPEKTAGTGVILAEGKVYSINTPASGMIKDVFVKNGSSVKTGQIIARMQRNDLLDQIQSILVDLDALQEQYDALISFSSGTLSLNIKKNKHSKTNLEIQRIQTMQNRIRLEEISEKMQQLYHEGLVTESAMMSAKNDVDNADLKIREIEIMLSDITVTHHQLEGDMNQRLMALENNIEDTCESLETLQINYRNQTKIISEVDGKIFEVSVSRGDYVAEGTSIAKLEPQTAALKKYQAVLFFNASEGKKIKRGMNISISPSIVKQEEFGYIQGIVTDVSSFPVTPQYVQNVIRHDGFVNQISNGMIPIEVKADLIPDPHSFSKYKWSSSKGPEVTIDSGLMCSGEVTIRSQSPISLIIPTVRKVLLGIGDTATTSGVTQ